MATIDSFDLIETTIADIHTAIIGHIIVPFTDLDVPSRWFGRLQSLKSLDTVVVMADNTWQTT